MTYYVSTTLQAPFEEAVARARDALAAEGFGVVSEIDLAGTLRAKLGVERRPYLILGACNPSLAHQALELEDKVGLMLPCNVIVQDLGAGRCEIAAIDPAAAMAAIENAQLKAKAAEVGDKLRAAIGRLRPGA